MNSPITRLVKSIDSTNAKNPYNQLLSWHYERFNQVNFFITFLSFITRNSTIKIVDLIVARVRENLHVYPIYMFKLEKPYIF